MNGEHGFIEVDWNRPKTEKPDEKMFGPHFWATGHWRMGWVRQYRYSFATRRNARH